MLARVRRCPARGGVLRDGDVPSPRDNRDDRASVRITDRPMQTLTESSHMCLPPRGAGPGGAESGGVMSRANRDAMVTTAMRCAAPPVAPRPEADDGPPRMDK
ncbi:hypothetical protein THAOC_27387, partial [Thalassiosira oceanica]